MKLVNKKVAGQRRVYDIEVEDVHNFYANGVNVHNCATDGGVSVIKDDGSVVDSSSGSAFGLIDFDNQNNLYIAETSFSDQLMITFYPKWKNDNFAVQRDYFANNIPGLFWDGNSAVVVDISAKSGAAATNVGLGIIETDFSADNGDATNNPEDMIDYITSTYNTGWMPGDIKLATLSDTTAETVTGTELVTNGTFDTDTSGWTPISGASLSVVSGALRVTNGGVGNDYALQSFSNLIVGKKYTATFEVIGRNNNSNVLAGIGDISSGNYDTYYNKSSLLVGKYSFTFTAIASTFYIYLGSYSTGGAYVDYDNVSVRLAESDRSVNNNGLQVFGSITKSPVATGADLVAYSGFSSSNYLEQPYNAALDFSGDYVMLGWAKGTGGVVVSRGSYVGAWDTYFQINAASTWTFSVRGSLTNVDSVNSSIAPSNVWTHLALVRSGTTHTLYVNGNATGSTATNVGNFTDIDGDFRLGVQQRPDNLNPFNGSLALWRISATAPTAEQIRKIYEDEKVLFQENAQATLYGASDAVNALAYDDATNLLHVGTSAGRSVFSGLRRVDNTTTAVGTAISAHDGLVAEE